FCDRDFCDCIEGYHAVGFNCLPIGNSTGAPYPYEIPINTAPTRYVKDCSTDADCTSDHPLTFCNQEICGCIDPYRWNGLDCVPKENSTKVHSPYRLPLIDAIPVRGVKECITDAECSMNDRLTFCDRAICDCIEGYHAIGRYCIRNAFQEMPEDVSDAATASPDVPNSIN
ncbi:hypothetical protein PFISCL1PPCAC_23071, partial [Pristionchus fissidentatus]